MPTISWLSLLEAQVPLSKAFYEELDRQLREHARKMAGVDLADGRYALMPPDSGFEVRFQAMTPEEPAHVIGNIEGYLVTPDAHGHPVVLAWHAKRRPELQVTPDMDISTVGPVEFFWAEFPIEELRGLGQPDESPWQSAVQPSFDMQWQIHTGPGLWLELTATDTFSPEQIDELARVVDSVIHAWNESHPSKVHYRGELEVSPSRDQVAVYIDFGSADREVLLPQLIRSLDQRLPANVIARGIASSPRLSPTA